VYTFGDYERDTAGFDVRGIVWSDAGAADPVAAAEWVQRQHDGRGLVTGIVSLGDPAADGFGPLVDRLRKIPLVATRIDAIGTIFGAWTAKQVRPGCSRP
jgi:predicted TIM-barrel fold metal-dependent hydrolase